MTVLVRLLPYSKPKLVKLSVPDTQGNGGGGPDFASEVS